MSAAIPAGQLLSCPRCDVLRLFVGIDGQDLFRCAGCEWFYSLSIQSPTGTVSHSGGTAAGSTAIPVASGGTSFTNGMVLLIDTGTSTEVATVSGSAASNSIPVTALALAHTNGTTFGQLLITPAYNGTGQDAVPAAPGWGF